MIYKHFYNSDRKNSEFATIAAHVHISSSYSESKELEKESYCIGSNGYDIRSVSSIESKEYSLCHSHTRHDYKAL